MGEILIFIILFFGVLGVVLFINDSALAGIDVTAFEAPLLRY